MASPDNEIPIFESAQGNERQLGSLLVTRGTQTIALPLASVELGARVIDRVAQVTMKQVFANNLSEHLEAVYVFPLAPASAISSFDMKVGDRVVKGVVQERAEARRQYQQALAEGKRTALLEQERDDVFTVQVGNLPPGEAVTIEITYSERLPFFESGCSELRLPLVVAPRYISGSALDRESVGDGSSLDTDLVPDASRISPPRLAHGVDPQTALNLKVEILPEKGAQISDLHCTQHATRTGIENGGLVITLARVNERLNRDFVLRWRSTGKNVKTSLITYRSENGETFGLLSIMPPQRDGYLGADRDVVFVLDRSGSMQGIKMTSAVRACSILLNTLGPRDKFAIVAFDNRCEWMPSSDRNHFLSADTAGIEAGEKYLRELTARGGTEMDGAFRQAFDALNNRNTRDGRLPAIVLLTDGEVGNESQILQRIQREVHDARLFTVGIDTAVNTGLLTRLARLGGGTAAFVEPGIQLEEALTSISRQIGAPLVTDLQLEDLDLKVDRASLSPLRIPDLFAGRASVCFLKLSGSGKLRVKGKLVDSKIFKEEINAQSVDMPAIAQLWAKSHIVDLEDQYRVNPTGKVNLKQQIVDLAVQHKLLTKFTAFVVVDESEIVNKTGESRKVVQPVEMPESWEMQQAASSGMMLQKASFARANELPARMQSSLMGQLCNSPPPRSPRPAAPSNNAPAPPAPQPASPPCNAPAPPVSSADADCWGSPAPAKQQIDRCREVKCKKLASDSLSASSPPANTKDNSTAQSEGTGSGSGFSSCSYGASVRSQVFEVVVRQAINGAPWKEICAGPMQVNGISPEEVEEEVKKRGFAHLVEKAAGASSSRTTPANPISNIFAKLNAFVSSRKSRNVNGSSLKAEAASCKSCLEDFIMEVELAFQKIEKGEMPDAAKLEQSRLALVQALAPTRLGMELPLLQRFLRATGIELVSSLNDRSITMPDLQEFWKNKLELFEEIKKELHDFLSGTEAAFWESSI